MMVLVVALSACDDEPINWTMSGGRDSDYFDIYYFSLYIII